MPDVLIVGGGIIGCTAAIELAGRDAAVTLVEANQPGTGATGASAGMIAPQYEAAAAEMLRLGVEARGAWPRFAKRLEELAGWGIGYRCDGMLVANRTDGEAKEARRTAERHRDLGLRAEALDPAEARELHGDVSPDIPSWMWLPDEAQVDAQRLATGLGAAVRAAGVEVRLGTRVAAILGRGGRAVGIRSERGDRVEADAVLLAAGAWSDRVQGLPRRLPVRPVRGQILRLMTGPLPRPLVATHDGHYVVPRDNDTTLCGSTMEESGFEERVTEAGQEEIAGHVSGLITRLAEAPVVERWAGLRPIAADRMPVLGEEPEMEGLFYATGHGRNGILLAPATARIVADLVLEGGSSLPWEPFSVERFTPSRGAAPRSGRPERGGG